MNENKNAKTPADGPVAWGCQCGKLYTVTCISSKPAKQWVGLTDEEIDALSQARSLTDELMDCVDRLGSEADTVDPRVWQHLLVYAPKPEEEPVAWRWKERINSDFDSWVITSSEPPPYAIEQQPLYTSPPKRDLTCVCGAVWEGEMMVHPPRKREWVGLTDEEVQDLSYLSQKIDEGNAAWFDRWGFARAIEAKLREKNT